MPEHDLSLLISAARKAGEIAKPYWRQSPKVWEKDANAGPVTEADLAVNAYLQERLMSERSDYGWLSEETTDTDARLSKEHVFIVDPIDGTRSFIAGEKTWAHSIAVARSGQITAAVVYLPVVDRMYAATAGSGAFLNDVQIRDSGRTELVDATVLSSRPNMDPENWALGAPPVHRHFRPSLAYRMALVAEGRFDAMLTLRNTWEWDVAAGTLIATEAGAKVTDQHGSDPVFNNPTPYLSGLIAGTTLVHDGLCRHLS